MKWILIMTLVGFRTGTSTHSVEFNRQDDCEQAAVSWVSQWNPNTITARAFCTAKHK